MAAKQSGEPEVPAAEGTAENRQQQQQQIQVDDSRALAGYANFCRVTGTPEEVILDLGLNAQPVGVPTGPVNITHRLILNYYTAKRLLGALHMTIQRHEAAFGVLEIDVQKRVRTQR